MNMYSASVCWHIRQIYFEPHVKSSVYIIQTMLIYALQFVLWGLTHFRFYLPNNFVSFRQI